MPSTLYGPLSGQAYQILLSGWAWSGSKSPVGEVRLKWSNSASGNAYVAYSGSATVTSGGMFQSGGGLQDGVLMAPGDRYNIPRLATGLSGNLSIYFAADGAASGQGRMYYDVF